jgi:hypothetical protein
MVVPHSSIGCRGSNMVTMGRSGRGCSRLVSILAAFALVVAHMVGGYAHASGHNHAKSADGCAHGHAAKTSAAMPAIDAAAHAKTDGACGQGVDHGDACDFMCNGGTAILTAQTVLLAAPNQVESTPVRSIGRLLLPASLDRPPRPSTPA